MLPLVYRRRSLDLDFEFEAGFGRRVRRSLAADSGRLLEAFCFCLVAKFGRNTAVLLALFSHSACSNTGSKHSIFLSLDIIARG
jgi:hypothetical protein